MTIVFAGPLTNPRLTNTTVSPNIYVQFNNTIPSGMGITIDCKALTAVDGINYRTAEVGHGGSMLWMVLAAGANTLTLTNSAGGGVGAGSATVTFAPPYT
jgi:hypothetical protein